MAPPVSYVLRIVSLALLVNACAKQQPVAAPQATLVPRPPLVPIPKALLWPPGEWSLVTCPQRSYTSTPLDKRLHVAAPDGELRGLVVDRVSKAPLVGAVVELDSSSAQMVGTNTLGIFAFRHVAPGNHAIRIRAIGYRPLLDIVVVDLESAARLEFELRWDSYEGPCWEFSPTRIPGAS
jgi:hypothetical protein